MTESVTVTTNVEAEAGNREESNTALIAALSEKKITIICPVVREFIVRNPQYLDLIDEAHPGTGAQLTTC